jgi:uncharacterized protein YbaR (Trm112 family)
MNTKMLELLCHPLTHEPLHLVSENLLKAVSSGDSFSIKDGIPMFCRTASHRPEVLRVSNRRT